MTAGASTYVDVAAVTGLLSVIVGDGDRGVVELEARTVSGIGESRMFAAARDVNRGWLPHSTLRVLESGSNWSFRFQAATVEASGGDRATISMPVAFVRWAIKLAHTRRGLSIPADARQAVADRINSFALPPTVVIDGAREVVALWRLVEPINLRTNRQDADELQDVLVSALNPGHERVIADGAVGDFLPLCGRVRNFGHDAPDIRIDPVVQSRAYLPADIKRAATEQKQ